MELKLHRRRREDTRLGRILILFRRTVALVLLFFAVLYWMRIVGMSDVPGMRYDTMGDSWRVVTSVLAVFLPVAAIGLWGLFPWGTSLWLVTITFELSIYLGMPERFGENIPAVMFHLGALATYILIKFLMIVSRSKRVLPRRSSAA